VFLNLIVNGLHAMDGGKREHSMRIATETTPTGLALVVFQDTGSGIAPQHLPRIFDPFFTTKPVTGMGLGLSICHRILTDIGGSIEVDSKLGAGTTFRITLPRAPATGDPAE
jgi:signal transduction histidine kinase